MLVNINLADINTKLGDLDSVKGLITGAISDIETINKRPGVIRDSKSISDNIAIIQRDLEEANRTLADIFGGIPDVAKRVRKIEAGVIHTAKPSTPYTLWSLD